MQRRINKTGSGIFQRENHNYYTGKTNCYLFFIATGVPFATIVRAGWFDIPKTHHF
jgi:hypothetical protein